MGHDGSVIEADGIVLRTRDGVTELIVNGVFAMDSTEVSSELALADAALPAGRVLVGGLGLGYTAARLLDGGAELVRVVELSTELIEAARRGATEQLGRVAADPRTELVVGDIADHVAGSWDAILLDVDNGPTFLIHDRNARLYREAFLRRCLAALTPSGRLVVWCEQESPELAAALGAVAGTVETIIVPVVRGERTFDYALYRARPASAVVPTPSAGSPAPSAVIPANAGIPDARPRSRSRDPGSSPG
jgi:spermidine synthase